MQTYILTLTDEQAQILGFALTLAKRSRLADAETYRGDARETALSQAARIEEVRDLLDCCPATEAAQ